MQGQQKIAELELSLNYQELEEINQEISKLENQLKEIQQKLEEQFSQELLFQQLTLERKIFELEEQRGKFAISIYFNGKELKIWESPIREKDVICDKTSIVKVCIPKECDDIGNELKVLRNSSFLAKICGQYYLLVLTERKIVAYELKDKKLIEFLKGKVIPNKEEENTPSIKKRWKEKVSKYAPIVIGLILLAGSGILYLWILGKLYAPKTSDTTDTEFSNSNFEECPALSMEEMKNFECPQGFKFNGVSKSNGFYRCIKGKGKNKITCYYPVWDNK